MYYMEARKKKRLGDMLIEAQVITEDQLMAAREEERDRKEARRDSC